MDINLAEDKNHREIPLHISCRFAENEIVRTHKTGNAYGPEEKGPGMGNRKNPFKAGDEFGVTILVGRDRFHVALNDRDYCEFVFRGGAATLSRCQYVQVLQDVEYIRRVDHVQTYPSVYPAAYLRDTTFSFSNDLPAAYSKGQVVVLHAATFGNKTGNFSVHFLNGQAPRTAQVFNFTLPPQGALIRYHVTAKNENKDQESFGPPLNITAQRPFKVAFGFGDQAFRVAVNGVFVCEYKYRHPMRAYSGIKCTEHDGLLLNILGVDHHTKPLDPTLRNFEQFSRI